MMCHKCQKKGDTDADDDDDDQDKKKPGKPMEDIVLLLEPDDDDTLTLQPTVAASVVPAIQTVEASLVATAPILNNYRFREIAEKPQRLHKKMGRNAHVQLLMKNLQPIFPIKNKYPTTYKHLKVSCIVEDLKKFKDKGRRDVVVWTPYLLVRFKTKAEDPGGRHAWRVNARNVKMVRPGPPNQYFFQTTTKKGTKKAPTPAAVDNEGEEVDAESDAEVVEVVEPKKADRYKVQWDASFVGGINIDRRGPLSRERARMKQYHYCDYLTKIALFQTFSPMKYYREKLLRATSDNLVAQEYKQLLEGEFLGWLGLWFLIQVNPGYQMMDFFLLKERTVWWNPPYLGGYMSGK